MKWIKDIYGNYTNADDIVQFGITHGLTIDIEDAPNGVDCSKLYCAVRGYVSEGIDNMVTFYMSGYDRGNTKAEEIAADYCQEYLDALIKNLSC